MRAAAARAAPGPLVAEEQIRAAFEAAAGDRCGTRPATVSLQQVIVDAGAHRLGAGRRRAAGRGGAGASCRGRRLRGARPRFSDDPGTKEHGGDLGWFKQRPHGAASSRTSPSRCARARRAGSWRRSSATTSSSVEKVRGPERQARHILITPEVTDADVERARERADSVAAGDPRRAPPSPRSPGSTTRPRGERSEPTSRSTGCRRPTPRRSQDAQRGRGGGPVRDRSGGPQGRGFGVVKVTDRQAAGAVHPRRRARPAPQRRAGAASWWTQLVTELRRRSYVSVRL